MRFKVLTVVFTAIKITTMITTEKTGKVSFCPMLRDAMFVDEKM